MIKCRPLKNLAKIRTSGHSGFNGYLLFPFLRVMETQDFQIVMMLGSFSFFFSFLWGLISYTS